MDENESIIGKILEERNQGHNTRKQLFIDIEQKLGMPIVSFFTSYMYPVMIENEDADMLEAVLQGINLKNGLALLISSPGGDALAAERIINICRSYSGTSEYWAIVPSKAKSAATMICFGANKIIMGRTSELGTIDPQIAISDGKNVKIFAVYNLIKSYEKLFKKAISEKRNIDPYLQQLARYTAWEIEEYKMAISLSEEIALSSLENGMMKGQKKVDIKKNIAVFLTPKQTKAHGRPIYADQSIKCGINVDLRDINDELWKLIYLLYIRTNTYVSHYASKCIESFKDSYIMSKPIRSQEKDNE